MIGPAFISAPDSASPQCSITPGNARAIKASAWSLQRKRKDAGRQPLGTDRDRDSNGPCLRVSQGSVPVSANATSARLPASCAALANSIEPKVPGGRNTTWPSARCGASRLAMSACAVAGAGHRISSAPRTASAMSSVTSAGFTSSPAGEILEQDRPPAARCAATAALSRRHSRIVVPGGGKSPAAANEPLPPPSTAIRISAHSLFLAPLLGPLA